MGLNSTFCISENSGTKERGPITCTWPGNMGTTWLIWEGNPTLPLHFLVLPLPMGARSGSGLAPTPSLDHSCLLKLPNHTEEVQQVLGGHNPAQSQVIREGRRPGLRAQPDLKPLPPLIQSVKA